MDDILAMLRERERLVEGWMRALRRRRRALAERYVTFADTDDLVGVPESLADELRTLIEGLVSDLDAQVDDLEGDLETVRKLRVALDGADGEAREELVASAETVDAALTRKGDSIEDLLGTADRLVDRFDRIVETPPDPDSDPGDEPGEPR
ncbi:hypothetical protein BRD18_05745 [Halobacteriales archaeon SW_7_71_33]|nr:MAG: hypothetical protein BRD18_05745 [Halobacteriales archaeon SW_7_71_33]